MGEGISRDCLRKRAGLVKGTCGISQGVSAWVGEIIRSAWLSVGNPLEVSVTSVKSIRIKD